MNKQKFNEENKNNRSRMVKRIIGVITGTALTGFVLMNINALFTNSDDSNNIKTTSEFTTENTTYVETTDELTTETNTLNTTTKDTTSITNTISSLTSEDTTSTVTSEIITTMVEEITTAVLTEITVVDTSVTEETATVEESTNESIEEYIDEVITSEYIVFKPSTHYIHKSTCRWMDNKCIEITTTEGIEARKCSECNPDIEIFVPYEPEPIQTTVTTGGCALDYITEEEYIYLCNTVAHEYGSDWISVYDKACVVACVMNRVRDGGWTNGLPSTIYNVLTAPYQFNPSYATNYYHSIVTQGCKDAVDYYFANQELFPHYTSFWGDGRANYFS